MTRSAKIILAAVGAFALGGSALIALGVFFFWQVGEGTRLSHLGYQNMAHQDYAQAVKNMTEASKKILIGPNRYWLYLNRGSAEEHLRQYDAAIADFTAAIKIDPSKAEPYEKRGQAYERKNDNAKALEDYTRAIERNPNQALAHLQRGTILYQDGEVEKALADFEETIRIWPNYAHGFFMRGRCYVSLDDLDRALASFDVALELHPQNRDARERRIEIYRRQGQTEKAFLESAELNPQLARGPKRNATTFPDRLKPAEKLDVAPLPFMSPGKPAPASPGFPGLIEQAITAFDSGNFDRAIDSYNRAMALPITSRQASIAMANRGTCYWRKEDYTRARSDFEEAVRLDPQNPGAYVERGFGLEQNGEIDDALKDYEEAIRLSPRDYLALSYRGRAFAKRGDLKSALADLDKAVTLRPSDPQAYVDRAEARLRQEMFDQAIADSSTAIRLRPELVRAYIDRIKAYAGSGEMDRVEKELGELRNLPGIADIERRNAIAWFRATDPNDKARNGREAVEDARRACELTQWKLGAALDTLAAAEAEAGAFKEAVKYEEQALRTNLLPNVRSRLEERLNLYRQQKPYRELLAD